MRTGKATKARKATSDVIELPTIEKFPTLKKGTKETGYVTLLQSNLKYRGYYDGPVDGKFLENTEKAVMTFQKDCGKPKNGIVGPKIWELLRDSEMTMTPIVQTPQQSNQGLRVVIDGLTKYQADLLIMLLQGHTECRIL